MLGFSWNGTLSRIAVGGTYLALMLSFAESRFWLESLGNLTGESAIVPDSVKLPILLCLAYVFGSLFSEDISGRRRWDNVISDALHSENRDLLAIVLENRDRADLLLGVSRTLALTAGVACWYLAMNLLFERTASEVAGVTQPAKLGAALFFCATFSWVLKHLSTFPLERATGLLATFTKDSGKE